MKLSHSSFCSFVFCAFFFPVMIYRSSYSKIYGILSESDKHVLLQNSVPSAAGNGATVIVTAATFNYMKFLKNLRCSIRSSTPYEVIVFPLDLKTSRALKEENVPQISRFVKYNKYENMQTSQFNTPGFNYVSKLKLLVVQEVLRLGFNVIYTDLDVVWCKDPVQHLLRYANGTADIAVQNDAPRDAGKRNLNSGFYLAKTSHHVLQFYKNLVEYAFKNQQINDQTSFIRVACTKTELGEDLRLRDVGENHKARICRWNQMTNVIALPLALYPNGASFRNKTRMYELPTGDILNMCNTKDIFIWHNNWSKSSDKKKRFVDHKLWMVDERNGKCVGQQK